MLGDNLRRHASRIDGYFNKRQGKPPYRYRMGHMVDGLLLAVSRVRLAAYVAWLALTGDKTFFQHWEARHIHGADRYMRQHNDAKELGRYREALAGETGGTKEAVKQLGALRIKVKEQARTISNMQQVATLRNKQMDALHAVWCSGGCEGGVGNREELTREKVIEAVRYTRRLVEWWNNRAYRDAGHIRDDEGYKATRVEWSDRV